MNETDKIRIYTRETAEDALKRLNPDMHNVLKIGVYYLKDKSCRFDEFIDCFTYKIDSVWLELTTRKRNTVVTRFIKMDTIKEIRVEPLLLEE